MIRLLDWRPCLHCIIIIVWCKEGKTSFSLFIFIHNNFSERVTKPSQYIAVFYSHFSSSNNKCEIHILDGVIRPMVQKTCCLQTYLPSDLSYRVRLKVRLT